MGARMTVKECYAAMGGDYEGMLGRFRSEDRIVRFLGKFLNDKTFDTLCAALEAGNQEEAFRGAHTLKGVAQNLSMTRLYLSSEKLTEHLRAGSCQGSEELMAQVDADYHEAVSAVRSLDA